MLNTSKSPRIMRREKAITAHTDIGNVTTESKTRLNLWPKLCNEGKN